MILGRMLRRLSVGLVEGLFYGHYYHLKPVIGCFIITLFCGRTLGVWESVTIMETFTLIFIQHFWRPSSLPSSTSDLVWGLRENV